ncbi:hypothetical protein [Listeria aquatica]|uniref:hypothetical protein n=1 Tax=Listeria aquatica TaxID=1494960 RepID=UPI0031F59A60
MVTISFDLNKMVTILSILGYIFFLQYAYSHLISPVYSYYTLTNLHPSAGVHLLSAFLAVLPACFANISVKRPSQAVFWILYLFVAVPIMIIPDYVRENPFDNFFFFKLCVLLSLCILYGAGKMNLLEVYQFKVYSLFIKLGLGVLAIGLLFILIKTYGLKTKLVGFDDVYDVRFSYRDSTIGISGYVLSWWSKIVGPGLFVWGIVSKKYLFLFLGLVAQFIAYNISGQKSIILSVVFIVAVMLAMFKKGQFFGRNFSILAFLLVTGCFLMDQLSGGIAFTELISRRLLMLPAVLTSHYFDFFSINPQTHLGHSVLGWLFPYSYHSTPAFLIGETYFGDAEVSANANLWADAFSAFGYFGVFLFTCILSFILWIYDSFVEGKNVLFFTGFIVMPIWGLIDSSLITSMLTHGILIAVLLACFLRTDGIRSK